MHNHSINYPLGINRSVKGIGKYPAINESLIRFNKFAQVIGCAFLIYLRFISVRFIFILSFSLIFLGSYFYSMPYINFAGKVISNGYYQSIEQLPTLLYTVEYFMFVFVYISVILIFLILFYRANKTERRKIRTKYIGFFVDELFQYIHTKDIISAEKHQKYLSNYWNNLRNEYAKRLLINILRQVQIETTGEFQSKVSEFLKEIELDIFIRSYLKSPFLRNNLFALKTIRDFHLDGYEKTILKFSKKNNIILRSAALTTAVRLKKYEDLSFLSEKGIQLSLWETNNIITIIQSQKEDKVDYYALLNSNLASLQILGIILTRINKRTDLKLDIKNIVGINQEQVNYEAITTFIAFASEPQDFDFLILNFKTASDKAKVSIINSLKLNPHKFKSIHFIESILEIEKFSVRHSAIKVLSKIDIKAFQKLESSPNPSIREIYEEVSENNKSKIEYGN